MTDIMGMRVTTITAIIRIPITLMGIMAFTVDTITLIGETAKVLNTTGNEAKAATMKNLAAEGSNSMPAVLSMAAGSPDAQVVAFQAVVTSAEASPEAHIPVEGQVEAATAEGNARDQERGPFGVLFILV